MTLIDTNEKFQAHVCMAAASLLKAQNPYHGALQSVVSMIFFNSGAKQTEPVGCLYSMSHKVTL